MLKKTVSVMLGGPIQYAFEKNGSFQENIKSKILLLLAELQSNDFIVFSAHLDENFGESIPSGGAQQIAKRDYDWMKKTDVYVAIFFKDNTQQIIRTDGTHIELGWASALQKKIIIVAPTDSNSLMSELVVGLPAVANVTVLDSQKIFESPSILSNLINEIENTRLG